MEQQGLLWVETICQLFLKYFLYLKVVRLELHNGDDDDGTTL